MRSDACAVTGLTAGWWAKSVCLGVLFILPPAAPAASDSWKSDAGGSWNAVGNWIGGSVPGSTALSDSTDVATFSTGLTATRTVTVDANRNIGAITFGNASTNGYTLSSGSLKLSNGGLIQTVSGTGNHNDIISSAITVMGDGGSATFRNNASGNTAGLQVGTLTGTSTAGNTTTLYFDGVSTANGTSGTARNNVSGVISDGSGGGKVAVVKNGSGLWTMSAGSTYSGGLVFNAGTIRFFSSGIKSFGTSTVTLGTNVTFNHANSTAMSISNPMVVNGNFTLSGSANCTWSGAMDLSGATRQITASVNAELSGTLSNGGLTKAGSGVLTISGVNTYGGGTTVSAGTLALSGAGTLGDTGGALTVSGGTLDLGGTSQAAGAVTVSGGSISNGTLTGSSYVAQTGTVSAVLAGGGVALAKTTSSILTLSGANTYDGGTTVSAGTLVLGGSGTLGDAAGALTIAGGTLNLGGTSQTVGDVVIAGGSIANGMLTGLSYAAQSGTVSAVLAGSGVALAKTTSGTLTLNGENTFTGATSVNEGTLSGNGTLAGAVTLSAEAVIAPGASVGTLTLGGDLTLNDGGVLVFEIYDESNADRLIVGGDLNPAGTTTIRLPNTATLTNGVYTLIEVAGTLGGGTNNFEVASPDPLKRYSIGYESAPNRVVLNVADDDTVLTWVGDGGGNVWDVGTANWTNLVSGGERKAYADVNKAVFTELGATNAAVDITAAVSPATVLIDAAGNYTFGGSGGIGGACGIVKSGSGSLTVGTANSFSGPVTVLEGVLVAGHSTALGTAAGGASVGVGGTLALSGDIAVGAETLSLGATQPSGDSILRNLGGSNAWGGTIIADTGTGAGRTRIISDAGNLLITGSVTTGGGQDFVIGGDGDGEIRGDITGNRPLFKSSSGTGTWTISGRNAYAGVTTVSRGTMVYSGSLTNAGGGVTVVNGRLLVSGSLNTGAGLWTLGASTTTTNGIVTILPGASVLANSFEAAKSTSGIGVLNVIGGVFSTTNSGDTGFRFANPGYGAFNQSGGLVSVGNFHVGAAAGGIAVARLSGGLLRVAPSYVFVGRNSTGVLTVDEGGTLEHISAANQISVAHASGARGEFNLTGGTVDNTGHNVGFGGGTGTAGVGLVNLNAGLLITERFNNADGTNRLSFGGGTLRACAESAVFLPADLPVYVNGSFGAFAGGAVIDTVGFSVTNAAPLLAPTGSGVSGVSVLASGSGYSGAPYVAITGDGFGATAVADMEDDGSGRGTLKVAAIRITNPGTGYTAASAALTGGVSAAAAALDAATLAENTSGGLTKLGAGTLALSGYTSYTGDTKVVEGTLRVEANGVFTGNTSLVLAGGTFSAGPTTNTLASLTVSSNCTFAVTSDTRLVFASQADNAWSGALVLTGVLGPTGVRFQSALTAAQLRHMRYQDGRRIHSTPDGYLTVAPFSTILLVR